MQRLKFRSTCLCKKLLLFTFVFLFTAPFLAAQSATDIANQILAKETALSQKISLHVAKDFFIAGEKLCFNIQAYHPNGKAAVVEKVAFAELLNPDGKPALQTIIELTNGSGSGVLLLPAELPTGKYFLRAYNNALKNGPAAAFAEKELTIVNGSQPPAWAMLEREGSPVVRLFPEGGKWIEGLQNTTAIWCITSFGEGFKAKGALLNETGDTILQTITDAKGKALFTWTPAADQQYRFVVQAEGRSSTTVPLIVAKKGLAVQMKTLSGGQMELLVQGTASLINQPVYVTLPTRYGPRLLKQDLSGGKTTFTWTQKELAEGIWPVRIYDATGVLQGLRWCYGNHEFISKPKLETDKNVYGLRQPVAIALTEAPADAVFTASVFLVDSLQGALSVTANDVVHAGNDSEDLDLALRTIEADVSTDTITNALVYLPQYEGALVTAQIKDKQSGAPGVGITAYLSLPGKNFQLATATSNATGLVHFSVKPVIDNREAVLQLNPKDADRYHITFITSFSEKQSGRRPGRLRLPQAWSTQLEGRFFAAQVQKAFEDSVVDQQIKKDTLPFYGQPDKSYLLDDYTRFPTLDEVMREYVAEVIVRRRDGETHYQVFNLPYKQMFDTDPLLLVDGVPFFDVEKIMTIDPLKLKKLDVVSRRWAQGSQSYDGIVSFTTYAGDLADVVAAPGAVSFTLPGIAASNTFLMPDYSNNLQPHTPDKRTQLFWSPKLRTDRSGKSNFLFFTSDVPGRFAIVVQTLTPQGNASTAVQYINVVK